MHYRIYCKGVVVCEEKEQDIINSSLYFFLREKFIKSCEVFSCAAMPLSAALPILKLAPFSCTAYMAIKDKDVQTISVVHYIPPMHTFKCSETIVVSIFIVTVVQIAFTLHKTLPLLSKADIPLLSCFVLNGCC